MHVYSKRPNTKGSQITAPHRGSRPLGELATPSGTFCPVTVWLRSAFSVHAAEAETKGQKQVENKNREDKILGVSNPCQENSIIESRARDRSLSRNRNLLWLP